MDAAAAQATIAPISSSEWLDRKRRGLSRIIVAADALQTDCEEVGKAYDDALIIGLSRILDTVVGLGRVHMDSIEDAQRMLGQWSD